MNKDKINMVKEIRKTITKVNKRKKVITGGNNLVGRKRRKKCWKNIQKKERKKTLGRKMDKNTRKDENEKKKTVRKIERKIRTKGDRDNLVSIIDFQVAYHFPI